MLYSEIKERENRFITTLKIVFPFLFLVAIFAYSFNFFAQNIYTLTLLTLLILVYVYYIFYLIYNGFRTTLIDPITKVFIFKKIIAIVNGLKNKQDYTLVFLHVNNIADINERYGVFNGDKVLRHLMIDLNAFLEKNEFKNISIGRCGGGNFLMPIKHPEKELFHLFTQFTKEIKSRGIDDIEIKVNAFFLNANYDASAQHCVEYLYTMLQEYQNSEEEPLHIKSNQFKSIIDEAFEYNGLLFKYQPSINLLKQKIEIFEVLPKIETKEYGILSKHQIERMINYSGYERIFDQKMIALLLKELDENEATHIKRISLELSPVTLRNNNFKLYINALIREQKIEPKRFIFEISEKNSYEDMGRFKEIILSYQAMGFCIALGNFGGNNCSLEYFKHLPIDMVKFDIEFTKKLEDAKQSTILEHYLRLARDLNIQTMVKFIDKEPLFEKVKSLNPDFIQGFYISKPKKIGELDEIR